MPDLETRLHELAAEIAFPATPDLVSGVRGALPEPSPPLLPRRLLAVAAVVGVAVIAGLAVPQARTAILRVFGIGAVRIEYVERLPAVRPDAPLQLGTRIDLDEAPFRVRRSGLLDEPDAVYANGDVVTLLYGSPERVRLLVTEIGDSAALPPEVAKKIVATTTNTEFVHIAGSTVPGVWIEGGRHVLDLPGAPARLAANTLVWTSNDLTLRVEGATTLDTAVRIAESLR